MPDSGNKSPSWQIIAMSMLTIIIALFGVLFGVFDQRIDDIEATARTAGKLAENHEVRIELLELWLNRVEVKLDKVLELAKGK